MLALRRLRGRAVIARTSPVPWWGLAAISAMFWLPPLLAWLDRLTTRPPRPRLAREAPGPGLGFRLRRMVWLPGGGPAPEPPPLAAWRQGRFDAGRPAIGHRSQPAMPRPSRPLSERYRAYIAGEVPGDDPGWGGWYWPQKRAAILAWYARQFGTGGRCLLGIVCGGQAPATQLDHCGRARGFKTDYVELFHETPASTAPTCRDCHVRRTELQRQGVDAWRWAVWQPQGAGR